MAAPRTGRPPAFRRFAFTHRTFDGSTVRLGYALRDPVAGEVAFEETLRLPTEVAFADGRPSIDLFAGTSAAVARAIAGLHIVGGMSYWKSCCPQEIDIDNTPLEEADADFFEEVWREGLGEFFYRNGIDPSASPRFPPSGPSNSSAHPAPTLGPPPTGPTLLLWGGGKDSAVSHEILGSGGDDHDLLMVGRGGWRWMTRSAAAVGRRLLVVERSLDPRLIELNRAGALNGHVPLNAYLAFAAQLVALLAGRRAIVASNEAGASAGNVLWRGLDVNHQWSKGLRFERLFRDWQLRNAPDGSVYFSLLRPLTELRIAKAFASHPGLFEATTSCNRNFTQDEGTAARWCGRCAKCVFVQLVTRPWLDDAAMRTAFGADFLADPGNGPAIEQLLGLRGAKPFECVGTPEEAVAAFLLASRNGRAVGAPAAAIFEEKVRPHIDDPDAIVREALAVRDDHGVPEPWLGMLRGYLEAR